MNELFITDQYKVLNTMYDNLISCSGDTVCPLSQEVVAGVIGRSRPAVNKIYAQLERAGYIKMIGRSKWKLSDKAKLLMRVTVKL